MIVAKFGGTSVADAGAIAGWSEIVRVARPTGRWWSSARSPGVTDGAAGPRPSWCTRATAPRSTTAVAALRRSPRDHRPGAAGRRGGAAARSRRRPTALRSELGAALGRMLRPAEARRARRARASCGAAGSWRRRSRAPGSPAAWVDIRPDHGDRRSLRPGHAVHAGAHTRARECLRPLVEAGPDAGHPGLHRRHRRRHADHARPGRLGLHRRASGRGVGVERVEIWTDVNGLMTADPRIVPVARAPSRRRATRRPRSWRPSAPRSSIPPPRCRWCGRASRSWCSTPRRPDDPGTTIEPSAELERMGDSPVRSISWKRGITVVNVRAPRMLGAYGFLRAMFEVFERHEVVVDVLASGEVSVSLTVEDRTRLDAVVRDLGELGEVWVEDHRAIVAVVGHRLRHHARARRAAVPRGPAGQRGGDLPGRLGDQHDVRRAGGGRAGGRAPAAPGVLRIVLTAADDSSGGQCLHAHRDRRQRQDGPGRGRAGARRGATRSSDRRRQENAGGRALTAERLRGADVAVEFTRPDAARRQSRAAHRGRRSQPSPGRPAGRPSFRGSRALVERAERRAAPRRQLLARRAPLSPRRARPRRRRFAGRARSSTPLYWRSITRPSVDAPSGTARELQAAAAASGSGAGVSHHLGPGRRHAGHAPRAPTTGRTSGDAARTRPGAATASRPARWRRPNGCPGTPGVYTVEDMLFGDRAMTRLQGCGTALVTPFTDDGARRPAGAPARWSSGRSPKGSTSSCPAAPPARRRPWTTASASRWSRPWSRSRPGGCR